ncbi:hypothetical protein PI124_g344 [Phytophthora idaei]|nr:hypothetical protein PI124_g344 [Phytophthora idaei]
MPPRGGGAAPTVARAVRAVTNNETELLSAAVLCAALSSTKASPSGSDALFNARAARELEMHARKSPLPHTLQLPVLEFTTDYVLAEAEGAFICAMRAMSPSDIVQAVVGSAVPLSQPYMHRFGGSRVHAPFWKRVRRLNLAKLYEQAQRMDKILLLCGHSIGGSIAKLAFCKLVYSSLPGVRLLLPLILTLLRCHDALAPRCALVILDAWLRDGSSLY